MKAEDIAASLIVRQCGQCGVTFEQPNGKNIKYSCPECRRAYFRAYRQRRAAAGSPARGGKTSRECRKRHYNRHRHTEVFRAKKGARVAVLNALRRGDLIAQPCAICGNLDAQAHHEDYTKPLDVIWFCYEHHNAYHKQTSSVADFIRSHLLKERGE